MPCQTLPVQVTGMFRHKAANTTCACVPIEGVTAEEVRSEGFERIVANEV